MNVSMTKAHLDDLLERAAERGAEKALAKVGLSDEKAGEDIRDLRSLLAAWNGAQKGFFSGFWAYLGKGAAALLIATMIYWVTTRIGIDVKPLKLEALETTVNTVRGP